MTPPGDEKHFEANVYVEVFAVMFSKLKLQLVSHRLLLFVPGRCIVGRGEPKATTITPKPNAHVLATRLFSETV